MLTTLLYLTIWTSTFDLETASPVERWAVVRGLSCLNVAVLMRDEPAAKQIINEIMDTELVVQTMVKRGPLKALELAEAAYELNPRPEKIGPPRTKND
jgi:hypothetical protein